MSILGRLRAALGREGATLIARAKSDLRMGLSLNAPACLAPLNRAIAALERAPQGPDCALMLGQALRAKAEAVGGDDARDLRARAVAKLKMQLDRRGLSDADRAALWSALAQAWMPLPGTTDTPEQRLAQLTRARDAQGNAAFDAAGHLAMARIELALCQAQGWADPAALAVSALTHVRLAEPGLSCAEDRHTAKDVETALLQRFPGLDTVSRT